MFNIRAIIQFIKLIFSTQVEDQVDDTQVEEIDPQEPKQQEMNFRNSITLIGSAGHGGMDPIIKDKYHVLKGGKEHTFENGKRVCEGVLNRILWKRLKEMAQERGYMTAEVHHEYKDYSLSTRAEKASQIEGESCLLCIHHNASPKHNGKGFEIFTTRGRSEADDLAEYIWFKVNLLRRMFNLNMRHDMASDGDHDKEADFAEIVKFEDHHKKTKFSGANAYLEIAFFDNWEDYQMLSDETFQKWMCKAILDGVDLYYKR